MPPAPGEFRARFPLTAGLDEPAETKFDRQEKFLAAFIEIGTISGAANRLGMYPQTHHNWLKDPDEDARESYKQRFKVAHEAMVDAAEEALRRRGVEGVDKTIWFQGVPCGTEKQYSDTCLLFYLKGRRAEVFRERDLTGGAGITIPVSIYLPANERSEEVIEGEVTQVTLLDNKRDSD